MDDANPTPCDPCSVCGAIATEPIPPGWALTRDHRGLLRFCPEHVSMSETFLPPKAGAERVHREGEASHVELLKEHIAHLHDSIYNGGTEMERLLARIATQHLLDSLTRALEVVRLRAEVAAEKHDHEMTREHHDASLRAILADLGAEADPEDAEAPRAKWVSLAAAKLRAERDALRAEVEQMRAELTAERAVSASLREQLASLSGKVLGAAADRGAWREPVVLLREPFRPNVALMREIVQDLQDGGLLSAAPEKPSRVECPTCHGDDPSDGPQAHQSCGTCGGAGTVPAAREGGR